MTPKIGQRWLWSCKSSYDKSETIVEVITDLQSTSYSQYYKVKFVQIINNMSVDKLNDIFHMNTSRFDDKELIYLPNQDKI